MCHFLKGLIANNTFTSTMKKLHEVQLISISRLMMAYGLAEISHYFKHHFIHSTTPPPPPSKHIKQKKLATYINIVSLRVCI